MYERLRSIDGVGAIYFEDARHNREDLLRVLMIKSNAKNLKAGTETFHITLDDSAAEQVVKTELGKMPGVDDVSDLQD